MGSASRSVTVVFTRHIAVAYDSYLVVPDTAKWQARVDTPEDRLRPLVCKTPEAPEASGVCGCAGSVSHSEREVYVVRA